MINSYIAFDIRELEKKKILSKSKALYKSKLISKGQWIDIQKNNSSNLFTPSIFMRVLLFIVSYVGFATVSGPLVLMYSSLGEIGFQMLFLILGGLLLFLTDKVLIKNKNHYLSGATEAGLFSGVFFIALAILWDMPDNTLMYPIVLFILSTLVSIRYLNRVTLVLSVGFLGWLLFQILADIGGYAEALIPFVFILYFGSLFLATSRLEKNLKNIIFHDFYLILKIISLLGIYIAGNYYVVRELSIQLMGIPLTQEQDIPFANLFYGLTIIIPVLYIYWGVKKKSVLFLRIGLLVATLSAITFNYYFNELSLAVTITIFGTLLITISLFLFNYLKNPRNGFTRENIISNTSHLKDISAIIASQTLGGNTGQIENDINIGGSEFGGSEFGGGEFGGGGASSNW